MIPRPALLFQNRHLSNAMVGKYQFIISDDTESGENLDFLI